jgi:competence ComEA-like helix-hairpin-helix protein
MLNRKVIGLIFLILAVGLPANAGTANESERQGSGDIQGSASDTSTARNPGVVNINTASVDELRRLPGVSDELANNIVSYRDASGPFSSVQDLRNVDGMSKSKFKKIKEYVVLEGDTTLMEPDSKTPAPKPGTSVHY